MFKITLYIFPFILFNRSLYHSATLQIVSNAFSKSTKAPNNFFFLLFKISKNENNVKKQQHIVHIKTSCMHFGYLTAKHNVSLLSMIDPCIPLYILN